MDVKTTEKLNDATVGFVKTVMRIADEGGYDRDNFLRAVAGMIAALADVATLKDFRFEDAKEETT